MIKSNVIRLQHRNNIKWVNLNQCHDYQIDNIIRYIDYQRLKILNALFSAKRIPSKAIPKLWHRLTKLNAILDTITNHQACLN